MKKLNAIISIVLCLLLSIGLAANCFAAGSAGISLWLDKSEVEAGTATTVTMHVGTSAIVPVSISGEAYSSDANITITKISDGDKELTSSAGTGRFAWMNASNEKEVSNWASVTFAVPANLAAGTYTLGVRSMSATDASGSELLASSGASVSFTVKGSSTPEPPVEDKTSIAISLDKAEVESGTANTISMSVGTTSGIVPVSLSGEAYSGDSRVTISKISDGDKELNSSASTGRFAWMNASNEKTVSNWATITYAIPADLPAGTYTLGVRSMSATGASGSELLTSSGASLSFTVKASSTPEPPTPGKAGIALSLDKSEVKAGTATTVSMHVGTTSGIVPVSFSGEAYSGDSRVTLTKISDGDKELNSSASTGRFAWMNASNTKEVSNWATVTFTVPADLPAGTYTLGVRSMDATDASGNSLLTGSSGTVSFKVTNAIAVTGVTINNAPASLEVGKTTKLTATVTPADATDKKVTWKSSDPTVATVAEDGTVTALKAGTAIITATAGGKATTCTIKVEKAADPTVAVESVKISNAPASLEVGKTTKLTATVTPANATDKKVTWSSSNTSVATVASDGTVKAVGVGTATITATAGGKKTTCTITVKPVEVTSVKFDKTTLSLEVGSSEILTATVAPSNATDKTITWTSSDTSVATVSGGKVTAVKAGTATITATAGSKTATCTVTVKAVAVTGVSLNKTSTTITQGNIETLKATVTPSNATNKSVKWSSSNTSVVKVDSNGKLTGVAPGTATVTVTTADGGKTATCKVTVTEKKKDDVSVSEVTVDVEAATLKAGETVTIKVDIKPENATNKNVEWSSSDENVATVENGVVTAVGVGEATITATTVNGGKTASCQITVEATDYVMVSGSNQQWTKGSEEGLSFTSAADPSEFDRVEVDGKVVDYSDFTDDNGTITLKPEFLETLDAGKHTISIVSRNGAATTEFEILSGECTHEHTHFEGAVDPTCVEKGYSGDEYCDDCGEMISEGKETDRLAHDYENGECKNCGATDPNYVAPKTNGYLKWLIPVIAAAAIILFFLILFFKKKKKEDEEEKK